MRADLGTLLIAVYCAACALFPADGQARRGRPELISDNELFTLMVAQMLLQCPSERVLLRRARRRLGHLFPYLPSQPRYNERCRELGPELVLLWKAIAAETLGASDDLRLLDTTPLPCGQPIETTRTSELAPWAGFGYCPAHSRRYWGFKLVLLCAPDGTIIDFDLAPPTAPNARRRSRCSRRTRSKARRSSATRVSPVPSSRRLYENCARCSCARAAPTSPSVRTRRSAGSASGSSRSSTRSRISSCSSGTAPAPPPASSVSPPASSRSAPASISNWAMHLTSLGAVRSVAVCRAARWLPGLIIRGTGGSFGGGSSTSHPASAIWSGCGGRMGLVARPAAAQICGG